MRIALGIIQLLVGIGAVPAGWALAVDPSGGSLGMPGGQSGGGSMSGGGSPGGCPGGGGTGAGGSGGGLGT